MGHCNAVRVFDFVVPFIMRDMLMDRGTAVEMLLDMLKDSELSDTDISMNQRHNPVVEKVLKYRNYHGQ